MYILTKWRRVNIFYIKKINKKCRLWDELTGSVKMHTVATLMTAFVSSSLRFIGWQLDWLIFDVCLNVIDLLKYDCTWTGETSDNSITYTVFLRKQKSTQKAQTIVSSNTAIRALVPNSSSICSLSMSNFENKACHFHCFCWWWKDARKLSSDQTF